MKPTAFLINTSRGPIVDEPALLADARQRKIAGAGLDTFDVEPLPVNHPLRKLDNVVLTPHLGYVHEDNYRAYFGGVVDDIRAFLDDGKPVRVLPGLIRKRFRSAPWRRRGFSRAPMNAQRVAALLACATGAAI